MKVFINAIISKMGGIKSLLNSFIDNIDEFDGNEYHLLVYKGSVNKDISLKKNVFIEESEIGDYNNIKKFLWYQFSLPQIIKEKNYNFMINFSNYGPICPKCKQILMLHNPIHVSDEIRKKSNFKNYINLVLMDFVLWLSLKGVHKLVVQTEYMKIGVIKRFKFPGEKISIIPSSPGKICRNEEDPFLEDKINGFIKNEENVISNISLYGKHKNIEKLLEAIKYIKENSEIKLKLILTIDEKENSDACRLINMITDFNISDYVMSVGNIDHKYINQILRKSKAFIFPSYAETFGIPFVEAMRFGLPIIAADMGFAHDVCGEAALYFKYDDEKELAKAITSVLTNEQLRSSLIKVSNARSSLFEDKKIVMDFIKLIDKEG